MTSLPGVQTECSGDLDHWFDSKTHNDIICRKYCDDVFDDDHDDIEYCSPPYAQNETTGCLF